jgi:hypothetical protein
MEALWERGKFYFKNKKQSLNGYSPTKCNFAGTGVNDCGSSSTSYIYLTSTSLDDCSDSPIKRDSSSKNSTTEKTSIQKLSINECKVYPNPTNSNVTIELNSNFLNNNSDYFYLYDEMGQLLEKELLSNGITTIPLIKVAQGIYYYRIVDENQKAIKTDKLLIIR